MKIADVDIGYVGMSNAALLPQNHEVIALDVQPEEVVQFTIESDVTLFSSLYFGCLAALSRPLFIATRDGLCVPNVASQQVHEVAT